MDTRRIRTGMSWLGVIGVGVTSWLSVRCSRKADEVDDPKKKALCYLPAVLSGIATSGCILGANGLAEKEIAALAAGCAYLARNRNAARKALPGVTPKENRAEDIAPWEGPSIEWTGKGATLCFEGYSGRLFYSSRAAVENAIDALNEICKKWDYVSLNDFYKLLGISETCFGSQYGWPGHPEEDDGQIEIRTVARTAENGETMLIIEMVTLPEGAYTDWMSD